MRATMRIALNRLSSRLLPIAALALMLGASYLYGWRGAALLGSALVLWALLRLVRLIRLMRHAAQQPLGYVDSAVMLHAQLHHGMTLSQIVSLTSSLGRQLCAPDAQPEIFSWADASGCSVHCILERGRLTRWQLIRQGQSQSLK